VRKAESALAVPSFTDESPYVVGYAVGVVAGFLIKGVLVMLVCYGTGKLFMYGLDKVAYAIYYFGSSHPNVAGQGSSTSVGQGVSQLSAPQIPSISTGPFTPNTLEQVRSDLAYQA
jgi:hypothetical protein